MKNSLPEQMKAVFQDSPGSDLIVKDVEIPRPGKGEVLVKMKFSPLNPSDLSQLRGTLSPLPDYPFIPGIEGSGTVVAAGKGVIPLLRSGKNVACSPKGMGGTWAEYLVTDASKCIPLGKNIDLISGSMLIVNPMTALAMVDIAVNGNYKSIVNNAASSSLGLMMIDLCKVHNIQLINIIRDNKQYSILERAGADYILDSSDNNFRINFKKLTEKLDARLLFDAAGGEQTEIMIKESLKGSRVIMYANLSGKQFSADSRDILQHGKTIEGFSLPLWISDKSIIQLLRHTGKVKSFISGSHKPVVKKMFGISEINTALSKYREKMSGGKILLEL
jgi:NADPH:quinone reductase-like Zn-dependent oxidoreductase